MCPYDKAEMRHYDIRQLAKAEMRHYGDASYVSLTKRRCAIAKSFKMRHSGDASLSSLI